jgi:two-component system, OmpR family, sensor histidine kinase QseC
MRWARKRLPASLSTQLLVAYMLAWWLTSVLVAGGIAWFLRDDPDHWADHSSLTVASVLAERTDPDAQGLPTAARLPEEMAWLTEALPLDIGYRIFNQGGEVVLWSSPAVRSFWLAQGPAPASSVSHGRAVIDGRAMRFRTVHLQGFKQPLWLEVMLSERLIGMIHSGDRSRLSTAIFGTAALSILLLAAVQWLVLRRLMRPIRRLSQEAQGIAFDRPGRRLKLDGLTQEMSPLVISFNAGLQRLEDGYARQVRFMADTAHELKTPLALVRAQLEMGEADPAALIEDIDLLSRQVQQLLVLAEVAEPQTYRQAALDVPGVTGDVVAFLTPLAERSGVSIRVVQASHPAGLAGDRSALFALLKNLIENAVSVAPPGTVVTVTIGSEGVCVSDQGPGVRAEDVPFLFQRFWRGPGRRHLGAGLGLSICQEVANAHGWRLLVRNLSPGAEFRLQFFHDPSTATETIP